MTLYFIGLGLTDEKDISIKGFEAIKKSNVVYLENYTSLLNCSFADLEKFYDKKIILASRETIENKAEETILKDSKTKDTAFLVVGDPMIATTHADLMLRAKKIGIKIEIIHSSAITSSIAETGLQVYKFGPTASIPFTIEKFKPETPYNIIKENLKRELHTLVLLDLRPLEKKYMTVNEGLKYLLEIESKLKQNVITENNLVVGCARIGAKNSIIKSGTLKKIIKQDFGTPLHCIIIPGKLHFMEEEMLNNFELK